MRLSWQAATAPGMATASIEVRPQVGPQEAFLANPADIVVFGGSAGSGKSFGLCLEPVRHIHRSDFGAVIFRRTYPEITNEGGLWDESGKLYPLLDAKPNKTELSWRFPSGARISFAHLQHESDIYSYQGSQIPLLEFDELTHFTERQFWYMLSRNRSTCGVRPYVRATTNPDADSWVAQLIAWWIDQESGYPIPERSGVLRWFVRVNESLEWADTAVELETRYPGQIAKSLTFIPAKLEDNPALTSKDPGYRANLLALPLVERERLLGGNWKIRPSAGKVFNRAWFSLVDTLPAGGVECLFWDFAATEKELAKGDPDFTAPVSIRHVGGRWIVASLDEFQGGPAEVERRFVNLSRQRAAFCKATGTRFLVRWEREPGSAGKREAPRYAALLAGLDARAVVPQGDKLVRARALAAQAEAGNVSVLRADWTERWLAHMHAIPDGAHDDVMDATAGAFNALVKELAEAKPTASYSLVTLG